MFAKAVSKEELTPGTDINYDGQLVYGHGTVIEAPEEYAQYLKNAASMGQEYVFVQWNTVIQRKNNKPLNSKPVIEAVMLESFLREKSYYEIIKD